MAFGSDASASPCGFKVGMALSCVALMLAWLLEAMLLGMLTNGILHDELRTV